MRGKIGKRSSQALSIKAPNHPCSRKTLPCSKGIETIMKLEICDGLQVERPCPVPKGLRLNSFLNILKIPHVERPCPVPKGLRLQPRLLLSLFFCRKTLPCSKGIETVTLFFSFSRQLSKDPALFQRD